jgi:ABC-type branched-subunit amino acid transport system ATPase component
MDAIRFSSRYWMIYKENTFGIATILNLIYKKSFIEVLFFTNQDVMELGVPLLEIFTPIETEVDLNEILLEPDFDIDGLVSPRKVIGKLNKLIKREFQFHISVLNEEVKLIEQRYESYIINEIPYFREIRIYFSEFVIELKINFEKYPLIPKISFSDSLSKIISVKDFLKIDIFNNWNEEEPQHITQIMDELIDLIEQKLKIDILHEDSQHLSLKKVSIKNNITNLSFQVHRGQSIGVFFEEREFFSMQDKETTIKDLFNTFKGENSFFSGKIKLFGRNIQLSVKNELDKIITISPDIEKTLMNLTIKKAITRDISKRVELTDRKDSLDRLLKKEGLLSIKDDVVTGTPKIGNYKSTIDAALEVTGLLNRKNEKLKGLPTLDRILFSISKALLLNPNILLFSIPIEQYGRMEVEKFNSYLKRIKKIFHITLIIYGPKEIVSNCDKIIIFTQNETKIGTLKDYIETLPQSGEILTIELSNPDRQDLKKMNDLDSIIFIEERREEKYKLFLKENPDKIIMQLMDIFGSNLYNFRRFQASLGDYLEYTEAKHLGKLNKMITLALRRKK